MREKKNKMKAAVGKKAELKRHSMYIRFPILTNQNLTRYIVLHILDPNVWRGAAVQYRSVLLCVFISITTHNV